MKNKDKFCCSYSKHTHSLFKRFLYTFILPDPYKGTHTSVNKKSIGTSRVKPGSKCFVCKTHYNKINDFPFP